MSNPKFAPREVFEQILEWAAIPTFDLILEIETKGFVMLRRTIAPYKNQWALPGLRMLKGETIDDVLIRVASAETGIDIRPYLSNKVLIGQYVGVFKTEHDRQDISTGYHVRLPSETVIDYNLEHFSDCMISYDAPKPIGAMYKHYLNLVKK